MSTTPTVFRKPRTAYTVIGGPRADRLRRHTSLLSIIILNRSGRFYRQELLEELLAFRFARILSVEGPQPAYDLEPLSRRYPEVRFIIIEDNCSPGERINLGIEEARSPLVLVLWSDMKPEPGTVSEGLLEQAEKRDLLCLVPQLHGSRGEILPTIQVPALIRGRLKLLPWKPVKEGMRSLFPFDYCGLYSRRRLQQLGGFDAWMSNPHWQKLDFGFRAYLWGEQIVWYPRLQIAYAAEPEAEDSTPDSSYKLFYLKNMAVRFNGEAGHLPLARLPRYVWQSDAGLPLGIREFREVRRWVYENRYRFKGDASSLIGRWEMPE